MCLGLLRGELVACPRRDDRMEDVLAVVRRRPALSRQVDRARAPTADAVIPGGGTWARTAKPPVCAVRDGGLHEVDVAEQSGGRSLRLLDQPKAVR